MESHSVKGLRLWNHTDLDLNWISTICLVCSTICSTICLHKICNFVQVINVFWVSVFPFIKMRMVIPCRSVVVNEDSWRCLALNISLFSFFFFFTQLFIALHFLEHNECSNVCWLKVPSRSVCTVGTCWYSTIYTYIHT